MKPRLPSFLTRFTRRIRPTFTRWRRRRGRTELSVEPTVRALLDGRANLHRTFSAFGHDLTELDGQTRSLLTKCEELLDLATGKSQGINLFQDSLQVLDQPIAHVDRSLQGLEPMLEHIERCDRHSAELLKCQLAMGEVLAPLRHMIVFFRIEAAQLEPEHQTTFLTVADEIHRLRELIDKTFDENVSRLQEARGTVARVKDKVKRDYAAYSQRITAKRGQIERAIESLSSQLGHDAHRDDQLRVSTAALNNEVSRLVSALQFEDILSQRINHVLTSLRAGPPAGADNAWLQLMQRQVLEVITHLRESRRDLDEGIDLIVKHTHELGEGSIMLRNLDNSTASIDGMVQLLLEAFQEITDISADNVKLADESHAALKPVSDVTENLSSVVIEVSLNIQLIALNAQVRSVQLGDGSGLEVLAARTAEISAELGELGDRTANEIIELRTVTQDLLARLDEMRSQGGKHLEDLRTKGAVVVERLHHMRDRTLVVLQEVCDEMETVRNRTDPKPQRLEELDIAEASFDRAAAWLERHISSTPITARERELLNGHVKDYTMASQRQVHAQITGREEDAGEHNHHTEFFVELPSDSPAAPPPAPAAESTATSPGPTRSAPPPPPAAPAPVAAPAPAAPALADNIELF